jgi:hypothetical protein
VQPVHIFLGREIRFPKPPFGAESGVVDQQNEPGVSGDSVRHMLDIFSFGQIGLENLNLGVVLGTEFFRDLLQLVLAASDQEQVMFWG